MNQLIPPRESLAPQGEAPPAPLMVAGVGASAGGLKALQQFVEAIPAESGSRTS